MADAGTTQDNFILPAPPVGGVPISNYNADLAAESVFSLQPIPVWLGTQQKIMSLLSKFTNTLSYHHPNQEMFQLHRL